MYKWVVATESQYIGPLPLHACLCLYEAATVLVVVKLSVTLMDSLVKQPSFISRGPLVIVRLIQVS